MNSNEQIQPLETPINLHEVVGNYERRLILQALKKCNGIQTRAAEQLGTTRRILRYRMEKLGIDPQYGKHA